MAERLCRLELTFQRHPIYFITTCTHQRRPILANPSIHSRLVQFAGLGADRGVWLGSYVLMPDHFHGFVVVDAHRTNLSSWIKTLKNALSKALRDHDISSPHWQKGFFDHILRGGESYSAKWDYVRENPVRAGLVKDAAQWEFSGTIFQLEFRDDRL